MAKVDGQIDLVVLGNVNDRFLVLHVHRHELVADLGRMLGVVHQAELFVGDIGLELWVVLELDALAFDLLAPAVLVQAFTEEDDVGQHRGVVRLVDPVAHSVQVKSEDFVDLHFLTVFVCQKIVISLPFALVGGGGKLSLWCIRLLLWLVRRAGLHVSRWIRGEFLLLAEAIAVGRWKLGIRLKSLHGRWLRLVVSWVLVAVLLSFFLAAFEASSWIWFLLALIVSFLWFAEVELSSHIIDQARKVWHFFIWLLRRESLTDR